MPVYQKINKVQAALAKQGISKEHKNASQGYSFRGVDDVYTALAPLLAEHGLVILPQCEDRIETENTTTKGTVMSKTIVRMSFLFVDVEDNSTAAATVFGEAADSGDKSTNKAMSTAYKYMAFQSFCIPTGGTDDTEKESPEFVAGSKPVQNRTSAPSLPPCPSCDKETSVIINKPEYGGGYCCYKGKGGCGAKF